MKFQIWYAGSELGVVLYMPETRELLRDYSMGLGISYLTSGLLWETDELSRNGGYLVEEFVLKKIGDEVMYERKVV